MGALSRLYTVSSFFNHATRDIREWSQNNAVYNERFLLVDRASQITQTVLADIVAEAYREPVTAVLSITGKYGQTDATYNASTRVLTVTLAGGAAWAVADVGKLVMFHSLTSVYTATIEARLSNTQIRVYGDNLPAANIDTVDYVLMSSTPPTGDVINISSLRMLRYGQLLRLEIASTASTTVDAVTSGAFTKFRQYAQQNLNRIVWCIVGDYLYLKKGTALSSYGTLTLTYPRITLLRTADTDYVDLLDGPMCQIGIIVLKHLIAQRIGVALDKAGDKETLAALITALYKAQGGEISKTNQQQKIDSLL